MDLSTKYLGFDLPHPLVPGASPLTEDLDTIRRLEDAGAPMVVLPSLFEEQVVGEQMAVYYATQESAESFAESLSYLPNPQSVTFGPHEYLEHVRRVREAVGIPVVGSLNGTTSGGWLRYASLIEQAGASALELNLYELATDPAVSGEATEWKQIEIVEHVKKTIKIPLAVKLSPFYTSLAHFANRLAAAGANALVVFNRFYQPDINVEELEVEPVVRLSRSEELLVRLRWLAILSGKVKADFAVTGGVHTVEDAVKAVMCGADAVQMVSALLQNGPDYLRVIRGHMARWLDEHEYQSLEQMRGSMSLERCPAPKAFERANYMKILHSWKG